MDDQGFFIQQQENLTRRLLFEGLPWLLSALAGALRAGFARWRSSTSSAWETRLGDMYYHPHKYDPDERRHMVRRLDAKLDAGAGSSKLRALCERRNRLAYDLHLKWLRLWPSAPELMRGHKHCEACIVLDPKHSQRWYVPFKYDRTFEVNMRERPSTLIRTGGLSL